ncbi:MAG: CBS domain-containing protein [Chitinophagales bacterium]
MGEQSSLKGTNRQRLKFISKLLDDVAALDYMIQERMIPNAHTRIGAEQEICVLNNEYDPGNNAQRILGQITEPGFTTELAVYNMEINLDPIDLRDTCFSTMHRMLQRKMELASGIAEQNDAHLLITGILPTIRNAHINLDYLTPLPRYHFMNEMLRKLRGDDFRIFLRGVDDISLRNNTVMLEACNTSFQVHLQVDPYDFARAYNWALIISAPVLAAATNSPLLMGKELWSETRIALFQQSIDTRQSHYAIRERKPRVTFASRWVRNTVTEIFKEDIARHQILVATNDKEKALDLARKGKIPKLQSLRLHNGTVYRWNRPCYGILDGEPHLRIENRYLPAGPSVTDEIANTLFWIGLIHGNPYENPPDHFGFRDMKSNFYKAARTGMESVFNWKNKVVPAQQLILEELIPLSYIGLQKAGVHEQDIQKYLSVIERRVKTHTGSQWQIKNFRTLQKHFGTNRALHYLTRLMHEYQKFDMPVSSWDDVTKEFIEASNISFMTVDELMSTDLLTVHPNDSLLLVSSIMAWRNINHVPVEDNKGNLKGIITSHDIKALQHAEAELAHRTVREVMIKDVVSIASGSSLSDAEHLLMEKDISCLPVTEKGIVIGILTRKDIAKQMRANVTQS